MRTSLCRAPLLLAAFAALSAGAHAQLSSAQQNALKQSCRSDFMSHCSGVTPGGADALACLQSHVAGLSPACKQAVSATMPTPSAPAAAKATSPAAPPKAKTATAPAAMPPLPGPPPGPLPGPLPGPPPGAAAAPMPGPTPMQLSAIKHTCRRDFSLHCRGVAPGGPEAIACLVSNAPRLTPDCKTSLAAIADELPPAPPPGAAPMPPPPSGPPTARPAAPVASAVVLGRACLRDLVLHCRDTGIGDGEKIACLKAYAASGHRLSVLCEAALKITPMR